MIGFSFIIDTLETEEQKITADNICNNYYELMYKTAYKILNNGPDAEDAVIQTVINICQNIDNFIGKKQPDIERMVGRYASNAAINIYNKNKLISERTEPLNQNQDNYLTEDDYNLITDPNNYGVLQKYIVKLDTVSKQLIVDRYVHGLTCKEIGKKLNIPDSTVSTKINRAIKKMRKMYEEDHKEMERSADKK